MNARAHAQALVELALVAPLVILLAMAIWDGGGVLRDRAILEQAARDGARVAASGYGSSVDSTVVCQAVARSAPDLPGLACGASNVVRTAGSVTVTLTYPHALFTPILRDLWRGGAATFPIQADAMFYLPQLTPVPAMIVPATFTPTPTPTPTTVPTVVPTATGTPTRTLTPTLIPTSTLTPTPTPNRFMVLNPTACGALSLSHGARLTVQNGAIQVNSSCASNALQVDGGSAVSASAGIVGVVGGTLLSGGGTVSPNPVTNSAIPDPLATLAIPSVTGLTVNSAINCTSPTTTLNPGSYPSVTTSNNCTLILNPGNYIIGGATGSLSFSGGTAILGSSVGNTTIVLLNGLSVSNGMTLSGTNVLFYNTCRTYATRLPSGCQTTDTFGGMTFNNNNDLSRITPPATGVYKNMTFFQDRAGAVAMTINSGTFAAGKIYGASMDVTIGGGALVPVQFIVDTLHIDAGVINESVP